jgi:predicted alpha/beta-hydrolase family hydrolase
MKTISLSLHVSSSIGTVSAEVTEADTMTAFYVIAHGAGAGMRHSFMANLAHELALAGIGTFRFNFPFIEQGKRRPDVPAIAEKTIHAAITKASELHPGVKLLAGGKSFGGRMTSNLLSKNTDHDVKGIAFVGFPLHPAGKPSTDRATHLSSVTQPMLFLQGTRDELAQLDLVQKVCSELPKATLVTIPDADHAFKHGKKDLLPELIKPLAHWANSL